MEPRHRLALSVVVAASVAATAVADPGARPTSSIPVAGAPASRSAPVACGGPYAEDLSFLSLSARDLEARTPPFSYAVRAIATYECLAYGPDASVKHTRKNVTAYGTAFGYRIDGNDTLLLTNEHVAEWPAVTDDDHPVSSVPVGCKRISDALWIVDNDHDRYATDDIPLSRVAVDAPLDVAVLRAHVKLQILPWKIGKSADLRARAVVQVKGFPLGAFRATSIGKVLNAHDHDDFRDWNHDDFVIDAALSHGNSGSPVLAVSCATGEFELVGIFHADYSAGNALNVAIAIDQARDLMTTLKRSPRPTSDSARLGADTRVRVTEVARGMTDPPFFEAGALTASVRARSDGTLIFAVYPADFPKTTRPLIVIEDLPSTGAAGGNAPGTWGRLGAVFLGTKQGLSRYAPPEAARASVQQILDLIRRDAAAVFDLRAASGTANVSHEAFERYHRRQRELERELASQRDLPQRIEDLASHAVTSDVVSLASVEADPPSSRSASGTPAGGAPSPVKPDTSDARSKAATVPGAERRISP